MPRKPSLLAAATLAALALSGSLLVSTGAGSAFAAPARVAGEIGPDTPGDIPVTVEDPYQLDEGLKKPGEPIPAGSTITIIGLVELGFEPGRTVGTLSAYVVKDCKDRITDDMKPYFVETDVVFSTSTSEAQRVPFTVPNSPEMYLKIVASGSDTQHHKKIKTKKAYCRKIGFAYSTPRGLSGGAAPTEVAGTQGPFTPGDIPVTVEDPYSLDEGLRQPGGAAPVAPGSRVTIRGMIKQSHDVGRAHGMLSAYVVASCKEEVEGKKAYDQRKHVRFSRSTTDAQEVWFEVPNDEGKHLKIVASEWDPDHRKWISTEKAYCRRIGRAFKSLTR